MSNQPKSKSKSLAGWGLAAVVLVALVLAVGLPGLREESGSEGEGSADALQAASSGEQLSSASPADQGPLQSEPPPQELLPMPTCWDGILRFDQNLSLGNFRSAIEAALSRNDQYLMAYLEERLTELVGDNPKNALQVLSWVEESSGGMDMVIYIEGLKKAPAVQNPKVAERMLEMGENPKGALAVRAGALIGLETQKRMGPDTLKRLKAFSLDETVDGRLGWNATRTIGRVMEEDYKRTGEYKAYWEHLLEISQKAHEPKARALALEMPSYSNPILDGSKIDELTGIMRTSRDRLTREMAALRLSHTDAPDKALEAYRAAFPTESDLCMRWALMRFAVRAGGASALPLVQQFAQQDPRLQDDYRDFQSFFAQGITDWERIWNAMPIRHDCVAEEGAPH